MPEQLKRQCFRAAALFLGCFLLYWSLRAAGGPFALPRAVAARSFRTESELDAMLLLFFVLILLFQLLFTMLLALGALVRETRALQLAGFVLLGFLLYLFACLRPYTLLDNHFTTAWFMTGHFTDSLVHSLADVIAGVFRMKTNWDRQLGWQVAAALLYLYPFFVSLRVLGPRNFFPALLVSALSAVIWLAGHAALLGGGLQLLLGLLAAGLSAVLLQVLTKAWKFGSAKKAGPKKKPLLSLKASREQTLLLALICVLLWIITWLTGRISSFHDVMKLFFGSSVYGYQGSLYQLKKLGVAQALALSYFLSLLVSRALSLVEVKMSTKYEKNLNAGYQLLFQIWILPLLSKLLNHAADKGQDAIAGDELAETLSIPLNHVWAALQSGAWLKLLPFLLLGTLLGIAAIWFAIRLPALRLTVWFFVWFSVCSYVYCLLGLFFPQRMHPTVLLFVCYGLNYLLQWLLNAGEGLQLVLRKRQRAESREVEARMPSHRSRRRR